MRDADNRITVLVDKIFPHLNFSIFESAEEDRLLVADILI